MTSIFHTLQKEVFDLFEQLNPVYTYHSFEHTESMLRTAENYVAHEGISTKDKELLMIAILFHDLGFIIDWKEHELIGAQMAEEAMKRKGYSSPDIERVRNTIIATQVPQAPHSLMEKIICDVDLDYLGRPDYEERSELLFQEWLALGVVKDKKEWQERELAFLENHNFHTSYGQQHRQPALDALVQRMTA